MPNFSDKENYELHCKNLQIYLRLGLKNKKIQRVLEFNQSQYLKNTFNSTHKEIIEAKKMETKMEKHFTN